MKTRLLRKLRREAKRRVKITNPLTELYNKYYIEKTIIKHFNVEKEWFHYPAYGCFLNTKYGFKDLATARKLLPRARKEYIFSQFIKLKRKKTQDYITKGKTQRKNIP